LNEKIGVDPPTTQSLIATAIVIKLNDYWKLLDRNSEISAILDPTHKLLTFPESEVEEIKTKFLKKYKSYSEKYDSSSETIIMNQASKRNYFKNLLNQNQNNNQSTTTNNEFIRRYFDVSPEEIECLDWYASRTKDPNYITLSHMAKDYFSIQATSVASEQMFSIAKHTLSPIRNRLDSEKARASLCLKSWIEAEIVSI
jgi:hypothetical protein